jgi:two-component system CheB/CheR fusion protein
MRGAVVVVDAELKILVWNQGAEDLWGLREDELRGKHVLGLDIGLPIERLKPLMQACLTGAKSHASVTLDAINRRGRAITCRVTATPLMTRRQSIHGVILVMEDADALVPTGPKRVGDKKVTAK